MAKYDPSSIEPKWQRYWDDHGTFVTKVDTSKPKYYVLDMFPYPSGDGLHVGHPEGYTATDIISRYKRMKGFNVLHPMGWDAFGLPAENFAIKTGQHPRDITRRNVATFKRQIKSLGLSYDWTREINTTDTDYVRWTQWIFLQLFHKGLAYESEMAVNWCPALGAVLANEEVKDGKSEIGGHPVERRLRSDTGLHHPFERRRLDLEPEAVFRLLAPQRLHLRTGKQGALTPNMDSDAVWHWLCSSWRRKKQV